jgi:hypothetical protein
MIGRTTMSDRTTTLLLACVLAACSSSSSSAHAGKTGTGGNTQDAGDFGNPGGTAGTTALRDAGLLYATFADRPCPSGDASSYESFGAQFFSTYCEPCHSAVNTGDARHGAPPAVTFDTLEVIRSERKAIWDMAGDQNTRMPPVQNKPSMQARMQLGAWLACGAPSANDGDAGNP